MSDLSGHESPDSVPSAALVPIPDPSRRPIYWLVPDVNGQPCPSLAIPVHEAEQLNTMLMPVMPMYELKVAAFLIPIGEHGLMSFLHRHRAEYPTRYRRKQLIGRVKQVRVRLLSAAEVCRIRDTIFLKTLNRKPRTKT